MRICHTAGSLMIALALAAASTLAALDGDAPVSTLRWEEGRPGCTFSRDDDGKYRYGFWNEDFGIVMAVDSQELEKVRRRRQPILALHLTVRYRGKNSLEIAPRDITLEFVKHYHDRQASLDPEALAATEKANAEAFANETEREMRNHPEKRAEKQSAITTRQDDAADMIAFLNSASLRAVRLDANRPGIIGWVLFNARSRWIGDLQKQEEFVLRIPLAGTLVEFPFTLPPSQGDLILRRRPER